MSNVSQNLVYSIVSKNHNKLRKSKAFGKAEFSLEKNNLTNLNNYRDSGFRDQTVGVYLASQHLKTVNKDKKIKNAKKYEVVVSKPNGFHKKSPALSNTRVRSFAKGFSKQGSFVLKVKQLINFSLANKRFSF
jgi:hypothetical protein